MMTKKLWYALNHPPARHPLFLRTVLLPPPSRRRFVSWATLLFLLMPFFLPALRVMAFFLLREAIIAGLWRGLIYRLNTSPTELDFMSSIPA